MNTRRALAPPQGGFVRLTGVELEGPSRSQSASQSGAGLIAESRLGATIVDHNKLSNYPTAAITAVSGSVLDDWACGGPPGALPPGRVHVVRNFIHHNTRKGLGYGVSVGGDGFAEIVGNTFLMNRHAIAADGTAQSGYRALHNLVLSNVPSYKTSRIEQADFDMHGSDGSSRHTGGIGGGKVGDGRADVIRSLPFDALQQTWIWQASLSGTASWSIVHLGLVPLQQAPGVGRFNDVPGADALTWGRSNRRALDLVSSARGPAAIRWSTQEMR